jgi:hypothetical protein
MKDAIVGSGGCALTLAELESRCLDCLLDPKPLHAFRAVLKAFEAAGGKQDDAVALLDALRARVSERDEDCILEAMDFATGGCSAEHVIWPIPDAKQWPPVGSE